MLIWTYPTAQEHRLCCALKPKLSSFDPTAAFLIDRSVVTAAMELVRAELP